MNIKDKRKIVHKQLKESLSTLDRAMESLKYSFSKCSSIIDKAEFSAEDQESFEALTSRFARTSDILTQKVFKALFYLVQESPKTFLDAANLLEKIEIIGNAEDIINIRELRNQISHEYVIEDLQALFSDVLRFVPELERVIKNVNQYIYENVPNQAEKTEERKKSGS